MCVLIEARPGGWIVTINGIQQVITTRGALVKLFNASFPLKETK